MPVSLNHSQFEEPSQPNTSSVFKRKLKTTSKMVDDALIELHSAKGVTLRQIYSFILGNYNLASLSPVRVSLIKKHLLALRESEDIINKTGKGFSGHLKLVDRSKFLKKIQTNKKQAKENLNATRKLARKTKTNIENELSPSVNGKTKTQEMAAKSKVLKKNFKKAPINAKQIAPVVPRQVTPPLLRHNNVSMFDTPMVSTQVHASTPFISASYVPRAPEVTQRVNRKRVAEEECGTPRSSLPGKKRRLLKRPE